MFQLNNSECCIVLNSSNISVNYVLIFKVEIIIIK